MCPPPNIRASVGRRDLAPPPPSAADKVSFDAPGPESCQILQLRKPQLKNAHPNRRNCISEVLVSKFARTFSLDPPDGWRLRRLRMPLATLNYASWSLNMVTMSRYTHRLKCHQKYFPQFKES